jgi:hypothetical protein
VCVRAERIVSVRNVKCTPTLNITVIFGLVIAAGCNPHCAYMGCCTRHALSRQIDIFSEIAVVLLVVVLTKSVRVCMQRYQCHIVLSVVAVSILALYENHRHGNCSRMYVVLSSCVSDAYK